MQTLRGGSNDDACDLVVKILNRGAGPQAIWDALLSTAGECLMRQPGIVGLHAVTTTNALHYAYQTTGDDRTRRLLMLQNAAFLPMFLGGMRGRGKVADTTLDALQPDDSLSTNQDSLGSIFHTLGDNRQQAAQQALAYLRAGGSPAELIDAARLLVFTKGDDAHDYKFSSAVLEDYYNVSKPSIATRTSPQTCSLFNDAQRKTTNWSNASSRPWPRRNPGKRRLSQQRSPNGTTPIQPRVKRSATLGNDACPSNEVPTDDPNPAQGEAQRNPGKRRLSQQRSPNETTPIQPRVKRSATLGNDACPSNEVPTGRPQSSPG